jgi:predicted transcriptional regulator
MKKRSCQKPIVGIGFWWRWRFHCSFSLPFAGKATYNERMEISFAPELEAKLKRIASQTGKGPDEVVRELVASYLDHDEWFRQEVGKGLASLDRGKTVSHEDVRRQMDRILGS